MKLFAWFSRFGLPLLGKELTEQAARRRTYVIRVVYAVLLFTAACLLFHEELRTARSSPMAALGRGRKMFEAIMGLQFAGVYLFMPALASGVIASEKEHNSLMLLFLTRLGPWTILFEKLLSRVLPMCCFLLMSLPLLAYAYSMGGVTQNALWGGIWMLLVAVIQTATLGLMCSAYYRTTVGAFVGSYLLGVLMCYGPVFLAVPFLMGGPGNVGRMLAFPFFLPALYFSRTAAGSAGLATAIASSIPTVLLSGLMLLLARRYLVQRAFLPSRNVLLNLFRNLDRFFTRLNDNRVTRNIVVIRPTSSLPAWTPIAWRETAKRSLGQARYLIRILVAVEAPVAIMCAYTLLHADRGSLQGVTGMLFVVWILAVLIVAVQSASLIAGERSHQTLDVLCVAPIAGREILLQKFRGVQRVMIVLLVPFLTIFLLEGSWRAALNRGYRSEQFSSAPLYLTCALLSVGIYLPLAAWLSFLIGLKLKTQGRAILAAVGALVAWCVLPLVFVMMPLSILAGPVEFGAFATFFSLFSPASIVVYNEWNALDRFMYFSWFAVLLNFAGYGYALYRVRGACLANADRWLERADYVESGSTLPVSVQEANMGIRRGYATTSK